MTFFACALVIGTFGSPADAQQQCTDQNIVGQGTNSVLAQAYVEAGLAWQKEAVAKLGVQNVYRAAGGAKCASRRGSKDYACTVSAKACNTMPTSPRGFSASSCVTHGCETCCFNPTTGREVCLPICK